MNTGVPSGTWRINTRSSRPPARRHPAELAVPMVAGAFVPWMASLFPPRHPGGGLGWFPESARMQQP
jgi:hypothetical protein